MSIIPFDQAKVPSALTQFFGNAPNDLVGSSASGGFPVVSIKGKVFHIKRGDQVEMIRRPGTDEPAGSIEVVILKANPNRSKLYYGKEFSEGDMGKPACYSNDGITPAADAQHKQSTKCSICPHNQWGSKITASGGKSKLCGDSRRIAIATADTPNDPMLVRVPAASIKPLEEFGKQLAARGIPYQAVVTKIGFDYSVAYPSLTFKPVGIITNEQQLREIRTASESEIVASICGTTPTKGEDPETIPVTEQQVATNANATAAAYGNSPATTATSTPKPVAPPAAATVVAGQDMAAQVQSMIDDLNFDA